MPLIPAMVLLATIVSQDPFSLPGPFLWGERDVPVPGSPAAVNARLYYPAVAQGAETDIVQSADPFPVIAFAHGFAVPPEFYDSTLRHLATRGYIVIATRSQQLTFAPDRLQYIADFLSTVDYVVDQNTTPGSFLEGRVEPTKIGATGHSLGGGVSIVASAQDPRIIALAPLSAVTLRSSGPSGTAPPPYADVDVASLDIPVSLINGSLDTLTPVPTNGQVIYDAAAGPRLLPNVIGGYHVGFTDLPIGPPFGDANQPGAITQDANLEFSRAELTSFFDLYLKGDQSAWRRQWGPERLALAGVDTQLDPGFSLASSLGPQPLPDGKIAFDFVLSNTTDHADSYKLFFEGNVWDVQFSSTQTPILNPGDSYGFQVVVTVPDNPSDPTDTALISARSDLDGGTRAFAYVTTAVPELGVLPTIAVSAAAGLLFARRFRRTVC